VDPRTKHKDIPLDFKLFDNLYVKPKVYWMDWETEIACLEEFEPLPEDLPLKQLVLFMCYTGIRHSDAINIKPANFIRRKGSVFLDFTIVKTKLDHNIELPPKAAAIVNEWGGSVPRIYQSDVGAGIKRLAKAAAESWAKKKKQSPLLDTIEKVRFSGSKRVVNLIPKYMVLGSHTPRRSFGRRWAEEDGDLTFLQKVYGHATLQQTLDYIGWTTQEINKEMKRVIG
jgi:integrase